MQRFLDKTADTDLELDARDLASNSLTSDSPAGRGGAKKMKKSASENLLMKNNARDSPLSAILSERSAEISYDWVSGNVLFNGLYLVPCRHVAQRHSMKPS